MPFSKTERKKENERGWKRVMSAMDPIWNEINFCGKHLNHSSIAVTYTQLYSNEWHKIKWEGDDDYDDDDDDDCDRNKN